MFIVTRSNGTWEARESFRTELGPRSRTLASFREMTPDVEDRVIKRSSKPLDREELRAKAARAGVPVAGPKVDQSTEALLRELARGRRPRPALRALLHSEFGAHEAAHHADRMKLWVGADKQQRAEALEGLLELGDALPKERRPDRSAFPKIRSRQ